MNKEVTKEQRRKFSKGDVVYYTGRCWELIEEEKDGGFLYMGCGPAISTTHLSRVKLVCAVEDREDRNAGEPAAAPTELQRGNLASKIGGEV